MGLRFIGRVSFQQESLLSHCHFSAAVSGYHNNGKDFLQGPAAHDVRHVDLVLISFRFLKACAEHILFQNNINVNNNLRIQ